MKRALMIYVVFLALVAVTVLVLGYTIPPPCMSDLGCG